MERSFKLEEEITTRIKELNSRSKSSGQKISAKPLKGYICALEVLEDVDLYCNFYEDFKSLIKPIKAHSHKKVLTISDFIRSNGGINKSIRTFTIYLKKRNRELDNPVLLYADSLYKSLISIRGTTSRDHLKAFKLIFPYCTFCWRLIDYSRYYCEFHHPTGNQSSYYHAKAALTSALLDRDPNHFDNFTMQLSKKYPSLNNKQLINKIPPQQFNKWTLLFAPPLIPVIKELKSNNLAIFSTPKVIKNFIEVLSKHYPKAHEKLNNELLMGSKTWQEFVLNCIYLLDPYDSLEKSVWEAKDLNKWMAPDDKNPQVSILLVVLQRYEAFKNIHALPRPRGPKKGDDIPSKNNELRDKIRLLVTRQTDAGLKINKAAIGRELNISRERVRVLFNEIYN